MNSRPDIWAIVPVKGFAAAKRRLSPVLGAAERTDLARLMLEDVLDALARCKAHLAGVVIVTADKAAAALAEQRDADAISCEESDGINAAIRLGADWAMSRGGAGVLVIPSDVPHLSANTVAQAVDAIGAFGSLALIPATDDGGTNLLACRPGNALPLHFGPRSFEKHCSAARAQQMNLRVLPAGELGLDIDRPENLGALLLLKSKTRTHAYLASLGVSGFLQIADQP